MKIALVSEYFYPKSSGGTEKYVYELAKKLLSENHTVDIITAAEKLVDYEYKNIAVKVIPIENKNDPDIISGIKPSQNLKDFKNLIQDAHYDAIHFHTLTPAFNLHHIESARTITNKIYFTAHVPSVTCIHGDLMQFGKIPCDGLILNHRCTACYLSKKNISKPISKILGSAITFLNYPKTVGEAVKNKKYDLHKINELCDKIFVFTHWQYRIFLANGFNETKIEITSQILGEKLLTHIKPKSTPIRTIGFVGRLSREKGLHILIEAFIRAKNLKLALHIAGIPSDAENEYFNMLKKLAESGSNIHWHLNLNEAEIKKFYLGIDMLCIPSIGYETGPFVLYEAFENNIPVIANNLGDMQLWKDSGYNMQVYNHKKELTQFIHNL